MQNKASAVPATSCLEMIWPGHLNAFPADLLSNSSFSTLIDNAKVHTSPVWDAVVAELSLLWCHWPQPRSSLLEPSSALQTLKTVFKPDT